MRNTVPAEISVQLSQALNVIEHHLGSTLLAVHLYGSALDGGLKPCSDIDLLVTVTAQLDPEASTGNPSLTTGANCEKARRHGGGAMLAK